jgi:hypothetical protein
MASHLSCLRRFHLCLRNPILRQQLRMSHFFELLVKVALSVALYYAFEERTR